RCAGEDRHRSFCGGAAAVRTPMLDSKLAHFGNQCRTRQTKLCGSTVLSPYSPMCLFQDRQNMVPLSLLQSARADCRLLSGHPLQIRQHGTQYRLGRKNHSTLDDILQLANVAWPVVAFQDLHHFVRNQVDGLVEAGGELLHEILYQQWNILYALPEWGKTNGDNVQPIEQVRPELLIRHHLCEILIGGCYHPNVD